MSGVLFLRVGSQGATSVGATHSLVLCVCGKKGQKGDRRNAPNFHSSEGETRSVSPATIEWNSAPKFRGLGMRCWR
jgi:hypothetical protein